MDHNKKIPITILTGFLGSGKTTLINRILQEDHGLRIAIVENEFGDSSIDANILRENSTEDIIEVSNGCMCCLVRKDWMDAIERLLDSGKQIDAIVIEASGASEPLPIAQSFLMNDMDGRIRLDSIVCMIDGLNYEHLFKKDVQIAIGQLEFADFIILNKCDLIDESTVDFLVTTIRRINAKAPILQSSHATIDISLLLNTDRFSLSESIEDALQSPHTHGHDDLQTWSYQARGKFFVQDLQMFFDDLDTDCYRVKGFVQIVEKGESWWIIQKAGARITIESWKGNAPPKSQIIFIGRDMKTHLLHKILDACTDAPESVMFC